MKMYYQLFIKMRCLFKIYRDSSMPCIKDVKGTNNVAIKVFNDYSKKKNCYCKLY